MSWYSAEGFDTPKETNDFGKPFRYWMKIDESYENEITFLDDVTAPYALELPEGGLVRVSLPLLYKEHQLQLNGSYQNFFTCIEGEAICPLCSARHKPSQVAIFTVIDHSVYKDKNGKEWKDQIKAFVVKTSATPYAYLLNQRKKRGNLRGARFSVQRLADKSPNVGDTFEFIRMTPEAELIDKDGKPLKPIEYLKYVAPLSKNELRAIAGSKSAEAQPEEAVEY